MRNGTVLSILVGVSGLQTNPLRTILSTLGVIIGVASLVAILSIGDSLERFSRDQITQTTDLQTIQVTSVVEETVDGIRVRLENPIRFSQQDYAALRDAFDDEALIVASTTSSVRAEVEGDTVSVVSLLTETTQNSLAMIPDGVVTAGSFLGGATPDDGSLPVVITDGLATRLAATSGSSGVGVRVTADSVLYTVVGVIGMRGGERPRMFTLIDAGERFGRADRFPVIAIRPNKIERVETLVAELETWLGSRFDDAPRQFRISTSMQRVQQLARGMLVFKFALGAIAAISLVVGGIGIMNVLLASVAERTREIGVRKATGARQSDILVQFLAESVGITSVGAVLGVVLGLGASAAIILGIRVFTDSPVGISYTWVSVLLAAVASIVVGLVFGTFPALRASRLSPVDAIRHE